MAFTLKVVDWRDNGGASRPEYRRRASVWKFVEGPREFKTREEAEAAAEAAWIEPDCNGVAPVCVVTER